MPEITSASQSPAQAKQNHRHMGAGHAPPLTPEQSDIMDLLEGRTLSAPSVQAHDGAAGTLQRDVVLATLGGMTLLSGLVSIFFMAALGAVLLVMGALLCVAAYEHAIAADAAALLASSRAEFLRGEAEANAETPLDSHLV